MFVCLIMSLGLLGGCTLVRTNPKLDKKKLVKATDDLSKNFFEYDFQSVVDQYKDADTSTLTADQKKALESYKTYAKQQKKYKGFKKKVKSVYTLSGETATVAETIETKSGKKAVFTVNFDESGNPTEYKLEDYQSLKQVMQKAGLNVLMGIGIVFFVLIIIMFVIMAFKPIFASNKIIPAPKKDTANAETKSVSKPAPAAVSSKTEENLTDDLELVAVIAAAIAASEGKTSTDGLYIRSIKRHR